MTSSKVQPPASNRHRYAKTRHRGLSYRVLADGRRRYYGYVPPRGRVLLQATREQDAVSEYGELRGKVAKGHQIAPPNVKFGEVAEQWYASKHRLRPWTRRLYRGVLDNELLPRFGHLKLNQIDVERIARFVRDLEARGLAPSTISNYLLPLTGTFAFAVRRGLAAINPCALLTSDDRPLRRTPRGTYEWSDDDVAALISASEEIAAGAQSRYDYAPIIHTAIFTGLRLGELLGLQWQDIDLADAVLHVRRQYTRSGDLAEPKTSSSLRRVPLSPSMATYLRTHKLRSKFSAEEDFVFASTTGGPLGHRNVQRRGFVPARRRAGLPDSVRFHDLRHAFASYAAHRGVPITVLSQVMGHANVGVTQRIYLHLYDRRRAEDAFREAMNT